MFHIIGCLQEIAKFAAYSLYNPSDLSIDIFLKSCIMDTTMKNKETLSRVTEGSGPVKSGNLPVLSGKARCQFLRRLAER